MKLLFPESDRNTSPTNAPYIDEESDSSRLDREASISSNDAQVSSPTPSSSRRLSAWLSTVVSDSSDAAADAAADAVADAVVTNSSSSSSSKSAKSAKSRKRPAKEWNATDEDSEDPPLDVGELNRQLKTVLPSLTLGIRNEHR